MLMRIFSVRSMAWGLRLVSLAIAFWWPALLRDPIYTPRQARLTGQELQLPDLFKSTPDDAPAMAIFWNWEHRALVATHWTVGAYRGVRDPEGRMQTLLVLILFWGLGSLLLSRWSIPNSSSEGEPRSGLRSVLSTPLWQLFSRRRTQANNTTS
jgi:hypothetical protein